VHSGEKLIMSSLDSENEEEEEEDRDYTVPFEGTYPVTQRLPLSHYSHLLKFPLSSRSSTLRIKPIPYEIWRTITYIYVYDSHIFECACIMYIYMCIYMYMYRNL
jgi:hypothetical protein